MIKKIAAAICCAAMAVSVTGCSASAPSSDTDAETETEATTVSEIAKADFSMTAAEVAEDMGIGISLGNTMEAYEATNCEKITFEWIPVVGENTPQDYETCWGAVPTTPEVIKGMKDAGFNTVRIPVFWGNMMENDGTFTINKDYISRVAEIVDYCIAEDLYVVVNIHHFDEFIIRRYPLEECQTIFTNLWTQIAEYFKDYPEKLVFEGFNEYLGGNTFDDKGRLKELPKEKGFEYANTLNQTFVDAVRKTGGNNAERVLIASGYWTNIDLTSSEQFVMPADTAENKLMVSVHYVDNSMYWSNSIGGDKWLDYIDNQCEKLKKAFTDKGIPVFIGETTSIYPRDRFENGAKYNDTTKCVEYMLNTLDEYGFVPVFWDTNDNFYSRTEYRIKSESDRELIKKMSE